MKEKILKFIINQFGNESLDEINYDTSLIDGGYIDSFSIIIVLMFLEKAFNIKILDEDISAKNFDSVNEILELVNKYKND